MSDDFSLAGTEEARRRFLTTVRRALGRDRGRLSPEDLFPQAPCRESLERLSRVRNRTDEERSRLIERLREAARPLNLELHPVADFPEAAQKIRAIVDDSSPEWRDEKSVAAWRHPLLDRLHLDQTLSVPVFFTDPGSPDPEPLQEAARRRTLRRQVEMSFVGITAADFCLADTATLVLRSRPGEARSVSLVPSIHIAVVPVENLLADLGDLYAVLRWDPMQWDEGLTSCMTLISGPSKTADIEATLVHGAHGPRQLHLILVIGSNFP